MLSHEGNENGEKTTIGQISKKALHVQHTFFLYTSLPLFCTTTMWNFQKLPGYTFYKGNVVCVLVHFFSLPLNFTLVATSISHFLTAATNFACWPSNKESLLCFFISRSSSLLLFFSLNFTGLSPTFSFSMSFSFSAFQICHTWQLI